MKLQVKSLEEILNMPKVVRHGHDISFPETITSDYGYPTRIGLSPMIKSVLGKLHLNCCEAEGRYYGITLQEEPVRKYAEVPRIICTIVN